MIASTRFSNALRYRDEADPRQVQLTPAYVLEPVRAMLGGSIDLDPCSLPDNPTRAYRFYSPPQDGAELPWDAPAIFVNPPYGKARERWVNRCVDAAAAGSKVVLLIPAHPDTRIFHAALATATSLLFIRGRVKFGVLRPNRRQAAASHPSVLIGWGVDLHWPRLGTAVALAATPEPTLDAERLARAVIVTNLGPDFGHTGAAAFDYATRLAAEYARLHERTASQEGATE